MKQFVVHFALFNIKYNEIMPIVNKLNNLRSNSSIFTIYDIEKTHVYPASSGSELSYDEIIKDNMINYDIDSFLSFEVGDYFNLNDISNKKSETYKVSNLISTFIYNSLNELFDFKLDKRCIMCEFIP